MINFRLYFARENTFVKRYEFGTLTKVYETIDNLSNEYDEYLIISHNIELNQDEVFEHKRIEHKTLNRKKK